MHNTITVTPTCNLLTENPQVWQIITKPILWCFQTETYHIQFLNKIQTQHVEKNTIQPKSRLPANDNVHRESFSPKVIQKNTIHFKRLK